jgi:protocatechuate 3,4-dioxygenase beta subunit/thiol-disulfide isomerase/thioredoxin
MAISSRVCGVCFCSTFVVSVISSFAKSLADDPPAAPGRFEWNAMLSDWHVVGPFAKLDANADELDRALVPNEAELRPSSPLSVGGKTYEWESCHASMINFIRVLDVNGDATNNLLAYAYAEFTSDTNQEALLALQHDDGAAVWLNGAEVFRDKENTGSSVDQDIVKVCLKSGTNTLLAKVGQYYGDWEFGARFRPADLDQPLFSLGFVGAARGDVSRLPQLNVDLLDDTGSSLAALHLGGGRGKQGGYQFTAFAPQPQTAPTNVRVRYSVPGLAPFDKSYSWSDVTSGNVELHPAVARSIRAKVVEAGSGVPIKTAVLRADPGDRKETAHEDGQFEVIMYDPLIQFASIAAPGFEPRNIIVPWPPEDDWTIKLARGGHVLRGRVLDADGKPLSGAKISAYVGNREINFTTDEKGRFEAYDIASATTVIYPTVTCTGYVAKDQFMLNLNADGPTEVEWRLESGAVVTGRVTAKDDGRPLAGITITVGEDRFSSNRVNPEVKTDAEGRYTLTGAKIGATMLHAFSDDFAPAMQSVNTTAGGSVAADFQLEAGATVSGRVTDPDGKPVRDVRLITDTWNDARMFHRERQTDADGKFEFAHMPTTPVRTDLLKQGYVSKRDQQFVGGEHYDITLLPVVDRAILVKLSDTGQSPQKLAMQLGYQWPGQADVSWQDTRYERAAKYDASDGRVHIRDDETSNVKRLLRLRVDGYGDAVITLPSGPNDVVPPEVTLEKAKTVAARVIDADSGQPLANVTVALVSPQDRLRMDRYVDFRQTNQALENFSGFRVTSSADGTFQLPALANGDSSDLVLFRKNGGFIYVPGAAALLAAPELDIPFPEEGTISGTISGGGQPLADEQIHLSWMPPGDPQNPWNFPFGYGGQLSTDQDGHYKFTGLGPGRYQIARMKSMKDPSGRTSMSTYLTQEEVVILPGHSVNHNFELPTGCIVTGQTIGANGKPAANCMVSARNSSGSGQTTDMAQSDADGYFTLTYLAPGNYSLQAQQYESSPNRGFMPGGLGTKSIKVENGISPTIEIKLRSREQIGGPAALAARGNANATITGSVAPDFTGKLFDRDQSFTLSEHLGKVVVVRFWISSIPSSKGSMSVFDKLYQKYEDDPQVAFIAVGLDADAEALRSAIKQQQFEFPIIYESREASEKIATSFGMRGIPMTFVVDREGKFAAEPTRGSDFAIALEAALKKPVLAANGQKPARLTIKFTLDGEATGLPDTTITLKALDAAGTAVREETIHSPGQASQFVWLYPRLADGGKIQVAVEADGCSKQEKVVADTGESAEIAFALSSPRVIIGRIAADNGTTPVAGAKVTAYRNNGMGTRRVATTDAEGQFKINVFPGTYFLVFEGTKDFAPVGMQRQELEVDSEVDPDPITVEACAAIKLVGTVNDVEGKPVAGAQVRSAANNSVARSDATGHFELSGVPSRGQVILLASKPPLVAQTLLTDVDPGQPITLTLQPQNDDRVEPGLTGKMPRLELHNVVHDEPIDWQPASDSDTLIAFCSLWHPAGRTLAERAPKWAEDHHVYVTIVSTDWSLSEARRQWDALGGKPPGIRSPLYAGPGGIEIAKDWKLVSPAQAYLISPQGVILKTLDIDKMQ